MFAPDPYLAEDAAELVSVEADEPAPILDVSAAPGSFAPRLSTEAPLLSAGYGEVEAAFAAAHAIGALDLTHRQTQRRTDGDARAAGPGLF